MTAEQIGSSSPELLVSHTGVTSILGTIKLIKETDSMDFYKALQKYVDSKEKQGRVKKGEKVPPRVMEFWPLIRVVKIQVKSDVLKTGAVVVDLPGVHDANQARAAVADGYMKKCTGLWVVAPITRAVDDKSAQKLLGEGFKRQLLMDGGYNSLTFICSKSDNISVSEAMLSLQLNEELSEENEKLDELEREHWAKRKELKQKQEELDSAKTEMDVYDEQLSTWEELKDQADAGETVYTPKPKKSAHRPRNASGNVD